MQVYFGGYSPNVEKAELDQQLTAAAPFLACNCATYLRQDGRLLFAIQRGSQKGGVAVFDLASKKQVGEYLTPGASPAYLGLNPAKKLLYCANYHTGWLTVLRYDENGQLSLVAKTQHEGHGPAPEQDAAHPHFFDETPAGNLLCCDLGTDQVVVYKLAGAQLVKMASWQAPAGVGPRHAAFANGLLLVVCELGSRLLVLDFDEDKLSFKLLHSYSTVAASYSGHNGAAALRVDPAGGFVYVSNRGEDTIAVFRQEKKALRLIQRISTFGAFPRDFDWNGENIAIAANQESSSATVYRRDPHSGYLTLLQKQVPAAKPTCVLFGAEF